MIKSDIDYIVKQYKYFMCIDEFPDFEIIMRDNLTEEEIKKEYYPIAQAEFDSKNGKHTLIVNENICQDYLLFHEFTHILDSEMYVMGDKKRNLGLLGYTEYHASQIELLLLLKAKTINSNVSFSMTDIIKTCTGEITVKEYIETKRKCAKELFSQDGFPQNIEILEASLGVLFNYWGLRSICKMYAKDYNEVIDNGAFLKYISSFYFCKLNNLMNGWMDEEKIEKSIEVFYMLFYVMKDYIHNLSEQD